MKYNVLLIVIFTYTFLNSFKFYILIWKIWLN